MKEVDDVGTQDLFEEDEDYDERVQCSTWHTVICIAVPFLIVIEACIPHSFGTFIVKIHEKTTASLTLLNWIAVITSAIPYILLPYSTGIIGNFSKWYRTISIVAIVGMAFSILLTSTQKYVSVFFLTYSLIYGICSCMIHGVALSILAEYFPVSHKRHVLATSLFQVGYPTAALVFNPLAAYLLSTFTWQDSLRIFSALIFIIGTGIALLMKPFGTRDKMCSNPNRSRHSSTNSDYDELKSKKKLLDIFQCCTLSEFFGKPEITLWVVAKILNYVCWFALRTNLMMYMKKNGFSLKDSSLLMITYASGEIVVCIVVSLIGDILKGKLLYVHMIAVSGMALLMGVWVFEIKSFGAILTVGAFVGMFVQLTLTYGYPAAAEVTGLQLVTAGSITLCAGGIGILLSPLIGGVLYDHTHSYKSLFLAECCLWIAQLLLYLTIVGIRYFRQPDERDAYFEMQ